MSRARKPCQSCAAYEALLHLHKGALLEIDLIAANLSAGAMAAIREICKRHDATHPRAKKYQPL